MRRGFARQEQIAFSLSRWESGMVRLKKKKKKI